jgi:hypothetical protein
LAEDAIVHRTFHDSSLNNVKMNAEERMSETFEEDASATSYNIVQNNTPAGALSDLEGCDGGSKNTCKGVPLGLPDVWKFPWVVLERVTDF